jgi:hypothetical protein
VRLRAFVTALAARKRLRTVLACSVLQFGTLFGIPMRAEQIADLMRTLNDAKQAHTLPGQTDAGDPGT